MSTIESAIAGDVAIFDAVFDDAYPDASSEEKAFARNMAWNGDIQAETLIETAMSKAGGLVRESVDGRDFTDGSDAKKVVSQYRVVMDWNKGSEREQNSYAIRGIKNKTGMIRIVAYNKIRNKVEFFAIPYRAYKGKSAIEIALCPHTGVVSYMGQYSHFQKKNLAEMAKA